MLRVVSWFAGLSHVAATVLAAFVLRPGTPGVPLTDRADYVATHAGAWTVGWAAFVVAGVGLLAWVILLRRRLDPERTSESLRDAIVLTAVGLALECVAHGLSVFALPGLAATDVEAFRAMEDTVRLFGAVLGQLGFVGGTLLVVRNLAGLGGRAAKWAGYANVALGSATVLLGVLDVTALIPVATGGVVLTLAVLTGAVARAS